MVPNCKKSKWLNAKIFPVLYPVIFSKRRHLEGLFSFNFEKTHRKNNFDTNLDKLLSGYQDNVIFMLCAIISNCKWRPSWNAKLQNIKTSQKKHSGTKLDQYQPMVLGLSSFSLYICNF